MKKRFVLQGLLTIALFLLLAGVSLAMTDRLYVETEECLGCHAAMPGIVSQWEDSAHWNAGVGCYECHKADNGDADAMDHNGFTIAIIVSPRDCGQCHPKETSEQEASHHAKAGDIFGGAGPGEHGVVLARRQLVELVEHEKQTPRSCRVESRSPKSGQRSSRAVASRRRMSDG